MEPEQTALLHQLKQLAVVKDEGVPPTAVEQETSTMDLDTAFEECKDDAVVWGDAADSPIDRKKIFSLAYEAATKRVRVDKGPYSGAPPVGSKG